MDWMWRSYSKLTGAEYCMLWLTFAAIMQWGLEAGIAVRHEYTRGRVPAARCGSRRRR